GMEHGSDEPRPRLQENERRPYSYGVCYVLDPAIDAVLGVTPALRIIESMAGIVQEAELPDLKQALDAQEFENLRNEPRRCAAWAHAFLNSLRTLKWFLACAQIANHLSPISLIRAFGDLSDEAAGETTQGASE